MPLLFISLILFISWPFLLVALALKSKVLIAFGLTVGILYTVFFFAQSFSEFLKELGATEVEVTILRRLRLLWTQSVTGRKEARFWTYPSSQAEVKVWVKGRRLEIFFSQGFLSLTTDAGLKLIFENMTQMHQSDIKLQNRCHSLTLRFERLKGKKEDFWYWFCSFWLYPLERWLKIAKI